MFLNEKKFGESQVTDTRPFDNIDRIIEWLEKQPADQRYCYMDQKSCLGTKYLESCGLNGIGKVFQYIYRYPNLRRVASGHGFPSSDPRNPWNYGEALERARQIKA